MAFIPALNVARTSMVYSSEGQIVVNVYWFQKSSAISVTDLDNLNTAMAANWSSTLKTLVNGNHALTEVTSVDQTSASAPKRTLVVSPSVPGTQAGSNLPNNVAIVISLRTALRGRSFRGRLYLPGRTAVDQAGPSLIHPTAIANLLAGWNILLNTANTAGMVWSIISHFTNKLPRPSAVSTPINALSIDTAFDSQRRRLLGRGS